MTYFIHIIVLFAFRQTDFRTVFTFNHSCSLNFYKAHKTHIIEASNHYQTDTAIITSILLPELIRYSIFFKLSGNKST